MREEDTTAAIHGEFTQQMRGDQISHRERQRGGSRVPQGDENTRTEKGLTIHKDTGWHSPVVAG